MTQLQLLAVIVAVFGPACFGLVKLRPRVVRRQARLERATRFALKHKWMAGVTTYRHRSVRLQGALALIEIAIALSGIITFASGAVVVAYLVTVMPVR